MDIANLPDKKHCCICFDTEDDDIEISRNWVAPCKCHGSTQWVMGEQEALEVLEGSNSYLLLLLLPSIPFGLITSKMIDWEKPFLSLMQRLTSKLPLLKTIMPSFLYEPIYRPPNNVQIYPVNNPIIIFSSALFSPSFATIIGKLLFRNRSYSNIYKLLLGGLLYITERSAVRIYQRHHNAVQWKS